MAPINKRDRASQEAAQALLGKVYLQSAGFPMNRTENYAKALQEFAKLEGKFDRVANYTTLFDPETDTSTELIFKIDFSTGENRGDYGVYWGPQGLSPNDALHLVSQFKDIFHTDIQGLSSPVSFPLTVTDNRFYQTIATFTVENSERVNAEPTEDWRPYKFITPIGQTVQENGGGIDFPLLRYADILLLTAEAENAISGPTAKAYEAINKVRRRAFNDMEHDLPTNLNADQFLQVILEERKRELALEGQRKDDLVRNEILESVIENFNISNPDRAKDFQPFEYIWPIPQKEVDLNPAVSQNTGY